jgi:hypothetical protein
MAKTKASLLKRKGKLDIVESDNGHSLSDDSRGASSGTYLFLFTLQVTQPNHVAGSLAFFWHQFSATILRCIIDQYANER